MIRHTKDEVDAAVEYARRWFVETKSPMSVLAAEVLALRDELVASDAAHDVTHAKLVRVADELRALAAAPRYSTDAVDAFLNAYYTTPQPRNIRALADVLSESREPPR